MIPRLVRIAVALVGVLIVLALLASVAALPWGERSVRALALRLMGPGSSVDEVHLHFDRIELRGLRIPPGDAWPAKDAFTAASVDVYPDVRTLFGDTVRIRRAEGHGTYLSVLRTADRQLRFLPTILPRPPRDPAKPPPRNVVIERASVHGATIDLYDGSIRQPPHRVQVVAIEARASNLLFPALTTRAEFQGSGRLEGSPGGTAQVEGWTVFARRDSEFRVRIAQAQVESLEPYFLRHQESGSASGRFDLQMDAKIHRRYLDAQGRMELTDFTLQAGQGALGTFMGMPRRAVIAAMEDREGRIDLSFEMKGNLGDARFSLNETFAVRVAAGIGNALGLTVGGVVKGIGAGLGAIGDAFGSIFGGKKDQDEPKP